MKRIRIKSRHPSHNPLRRQLPKLPFRSVVRFGSTTEVDDVDVEINNTQSIKNSADKLLMKQCFTKHNIKTAIWFSTHNKNSNIGDTDYIIGKANEIGYPIVVKHRFGSRGTGNYLIKNEEELRNCISTKDLNKYIFEKFYNYNREYRFHMTKEGCFYSIRKMLKTDTPENKRWFRNDSNSVWILPDNEGFDKPINFDLIEQECIKALTSIGLDIGCFDIRIQSKLDSEGRVRKNPEFIIIESGSAPSFGEITLQKYLEVLPNLIKDKYENRNNQ